MKPATIFLIVGGLLAAVVVTGASIAGERTPSFLIPHWDSEKQVAGAGMTSASPREDAEQGIHTIRLGKRGFEPKTLSIERGESVRIVNVTNGAMRIVMVRQESPRLEYVQPHAGGINSSFELSLHEPGTWKVTAMNSPAGFEAFLTVR